MGEAEFLIAGLLVAVAGMSALARALSIPYPIVLVVGGALVGFIPGLPTITLDPEVVLVVFLPPLLYAAAFFSDIAELRRNLRALSLSSIGLVIATMAAVAIVAHALVPGLPWAAAFALGAIVSPTDPLAAALIMRRLGAPRTLVGGAEGEGLFNDATALVAYRMAVAVVVGGTFDVAEAGVRFFGGAVGGIAIGLAVGWLVALIRKWTADIQVSVTISLLSGYAAFVPADVLGASGVLAAVTTGLYMGVRGPKLISARTRLEGFMVWDILTFLLNAILFVLVGAQLRSVIEGLGDRSATTLAWYAVAVSGVVVVTRLVWFFTVPYLIRMLDRRESQRARRVAAQGRVVLAWSGMRGSVSLAAALALPLTTATGVPFPERDLIIFLTYAVIFVTLVLQGLTLPVLIRLLRLTGDQAEDEAELVARQAATRVALAEIETLAELEWTREDSVERLRAAYEYRSRRLAARAGEIEDPGYEDRSLAYQRMLLALLDTQRREVIRLRDQGHISNDLMNRLIREFDLEESRLEI